MVGGGIVCLTFTHWQPMGIHLFELLSAFPHFTIAISLVVGALTLVLKRWALVAAAFIGITLNALLILSAPVIAPNPSLETDITVAQVNLYSNNRMETEQFPFAAFETVDVLTIQELNEVYHSSLARTLQTTFPYFIEEPWDTCCYGIGLYSKWRILNYEIVRPFEVPIIRAEILCNDVPVTVISLHTMAPAFPDMTTERNKQLHLVSEMASKANGPCIVLGDFNLVPWDSEFSRFLENGKLKSVRDGFQATYPMDIGIPLIPIDHICFSDHFTATECRTVVIPGSDHKGMVASLAFKDR